MQYTDSEDEEPHQTSFASIIPYRIISKSQVNMFEFLNEIKKAKKLSIDKTQELIHQLNIIQEKVNELATMRCDENYLDNMFVYAAEMFVFDEKMHVIFERTKSGCMQTDALKSKIDEVLLLQTIAYNNYKMSHKSKFIDNEIIKKHNNVLNNKHYITINNIEYQTLTFEDIRSEILYRKSGALPLMTIAEVKREHLHSDDALCMFDHLHNTNIKIKNTTYVNDNGHERNEFTFYLE